MFEIYGHFNFKNQHTTKSIFQNTLKAIYKIPIKLTISILDKKVTLADIDSDSLFILEKK